MMAYSIPERTLEKWAKTHLVLEVETPLYFCFLFRYTGSTCSYGGIPIQTEFRIFLRPEGERYRITAAEIAFLPEDRGLENTCRHQMRGPDFLLQNIALTGIVGSDLEEYLARDLPTNPAGCYCAPEHVYHKWYMVLGTIACFLRHRPAHP